MFHLSFIIEHFPFVPQLYFEIQLAYILQTQDRIRQQHRVMWLLSLT